MDMSNKDFPDPVFVAEISVKDKLEYINVDWLEHME